MKFRRRSLPVPAWLRRLAAAAQAPVVPRFEERMSLRRLDPHRGSSSSDGSSREALPLPEPRPRPAAWRGRR